MFEAIEEEDRVVENDDGGNPALLGSCNDRAKQLHASSSGLPSFLPRSSDCFPCCFKNNLSHMYDSLDSFFGDLFSYHSVNLQLAKMPPLCQSSIFIRFIFLFYAYERTFFLSC